MHMVYRASPWRSLVCHHGSLDISALSAPLRDFHTNISLFNPSISDAYAAQLSFVETLLRYDLPAWRISELISDHIAWLYRQSIAATLDEMQAQGWGKPPVDYCVVTLGSAARFESLLGPDQDNALIIDDYPDARHVEIDGYFQALGERFTQRLDEAGIPLCRGHVMARWPMWRKRLSEWQQQFAIWSANRQVKRVQQTNIWLDFYPVAGNPELAQTLGQRVRSTLSSAPLFMNEMAALLDELPVALDRFGRIASHPGLAAPYDQAIDLKRQGLMPLISAARLLCVRYQRSEIGTRERLTALAHFTRALTKEQANLLIAAFKRMQHLLLDQQRHNKSHGQTADGWVDLRRLRDDERLLLKFDLQQIKAFVNQVKRL